MAEISAKMVNELRSKTGLGMMECKKALSETAGDVQKAIDYFRKKGVKTSITQRAATEGRVAVAVSPDRKRGAIIEINCNTDFTAKSDPVAKIAAAAAEKLLANPDLKLGDDPTIKEQLVTVSQQTGENVMIGRSAAISTASGAVGSYVYSVAGKGKSAVLVAVAGKADDTVFRDLGVQIVAARPIALSRQDVAAEIVAREREIAVEQAKATGKPQEIAEKIAIGKLNGFYAERVLLDQEYVNPEIFKGSVTNYLKAKGVTIEKYVRIEVGQ
ncbi:MAG: translation elongation factor Ts [Tepidisphaeraceae bacterium]|jgi:elongation factor Ts